MNPKLIFVSAIALTMAAAPIAASAQSGFRAIGSDGTLSGAEGPRGGQAFAGRGAMRGDGGAVAGTRHGFRSPNGTQGVRSRSIARGEDGAAAISRGVGLSGGDRSISRTGTVMRDTDGTVIGDRTGTITNAETGNSLNRTVAYDATTGERTSAVTCVGADGSSIDC